MAFQGCRALFVLYVLAISVTNISGLENPGRLDRFFRNIGNSIPNGPDFTAFTPKPDDRIYGVKESDDPAKAARTSSFQSSNDDPMEKLTPTNDPEYQATTPDTDGKRFNDIIYILQHWDEKRLKIDMEKYNKELAEISERLLMRTQPTEMTPTTRDPNYQDPQFIRDENRMRTIISLLQDPSEHRLWSDREIYRQELAVLLERRLMRTNPTNLPGDKPGVAIAEHRQPAVFSSGSGTRSSPAAQNTPSLSDKIVEYFSDLKETMKETNDNKLIIMCCVIFFIFCVFTAAVLAMTVFSWKRAKTEDKKDIELTSVAVQTLRPP